jgi:hypothetical protein
VLNRHLNAAHTLTLLVHFSPVHVLVLCLGTWSRLRTDTIHKHLNAIHISTLHSAETEPCPHTDIKLRHLTDRRHVKIFKSGPHTRTDTKLRPLNPVHIQTLCQETWIRSIYRHYAKTLESISHTDATFWSLNPFHLQMLWQDISIQPTYWQCGHTLTYWHYSKLCDSNLHTDTIVSHVTPFYTLMSNMFKGFCNIRIFQDNLPKLDKNFVHISYVCPACYMAAWYILDLITLSYTFEA